MKAPQPLPCPLPVRAQLTLQSTGAGGAEVTLASQRLWEAGQLATSTGWGSLHSRRQGWTWGCRGEAAVRSLTRGWRG